MKTTLSVTVTVGFLTRQGGTGVSGAVLDQLRDDLQVLRSGRGSGSKLLVGQGRCGEFVDRSVGFWEDFPVFFWLF